jgi:hypothetical protein
MGEGSKGSQEITMEEDISKDISEDKGMKKVPRWRGFFFLPFFEVSRNMKVHKKWGFDEYIRRRWWGSKKRKFSPQRESGVPFNA